MDSGRFYISLWVDSLEVGTLMLRTGVPFVPPAGFSASGQGTPGPCSCRILTLRKFGFLQVFPVLGGGF